MTGRQEGKEGQGRQRKKEGIEGREEWQEGRKDGRAVGKTRTGQ
jgi:hypothetical protein